MKHLTSTSFKALMSLFMLNLISAMAFAQDTSSRTTTTSSTVTTEQSWYMQPWAWVVGGIVLLILIISMFRSKSSAGTRDTVTYTKTVKRDEDVE